MTVHTAIPTVGEYATLALDSLTQIRSNRNTPEIDVEPTDTAIAVTLLDACLHLLDKFPSSTRRQFARLLPFTPLELAMLETVNVSKNETLVQQVRSRVDLWINQSPLLVNEENVNVADFLAELRTHLDLWSQRQQVDDQIRRLKGERVT